MVFIEQNVGSESAIPLDEIVPAIPDEIGLSATQQSEKYGLFVQRAVRVRDVAQRASLHAARDAYN